MTQPFPAFLKTLAASPDSARAAIASAYIANADVPVTDDSTVTFLYEGDARAAAVPSDLNGWDPGAGPMTKLPGTRLFFRTETLPPDGRLEYKLWVDSAWMLDPRNRRTAAGGYGENSDVWMPQYVQSLAAQYTPGIRRGRIDTLQIRSRALGRVYPVYVYTAPGRAPKRPRPVLYVTDGGDYLALGRLNTILDNLLAARKIAPLVAVFIDPHAVEPAGPRDYRMTDYAASDPYLDFLEHDVAPLIERRYHGSALPEQRLIMGVSMGGIEATYAVLRRPEFVRNCAAQSPAYYQADSAVIRLSASLDAKGRRVYIDAGTVRDTEAEATLVAGQMRARGAEVAFTAYHEGHNWTNWRARLPLILTTFFPRR